MLASSAELYSVPWKCQALQSPEVFPLAMENHFQPASTFAILTLQAFSLSLRSVTNIASAIHVTSSGLKGTGLHFIESAHKQEKACNFY